MRWAACESFLQYLVPRKWVDSPGSNSVCIISGLRLHYLLGMNEDDVTCKACPWLPLMRFDLSLSPDTYTNEAAWSIVELMTAVICACLPTLRPLFRYFGHAVTNNPSSSGGHWKSPNNIALEADEEILNKAETKSSAGEWKTSGYNISLPENVGRPGRTTMRDELEIGNTYDMCTYSPEYYAPCLKEHLDSQVFPKQNHL